MKKLAYLAPQITALSATFVYKEILGLEARGYEVLPVSIHPDEAFAKEVAELNKRTDSIYSRSTFTFILSFITALLFHPVRTVKVVSLYLSDIFSLGSPKLQQIKLGYQMLAGIWLAEKLRKADVEHLHIHFGDVPAQVGMYAAKHANIPFSFTIHANDLFQHGRLLKQKSDRACAVVTISNFNVNLLREMEIPASKLHIVRCGIDPEQFPYSQPGEIHTPATVGLVARLVEKKGVDTLIQAAAILSKGGKEIEVHIAGDGPETASLKKLAHDLDIEGKIIFEGRIANSEIADWMRSLDLFVLPARKDQNGDMDGIPVALMESMGLGVSVVSTKLSGIPELIIDNKTGLLAEPEDSNGLAEIMKNLIDDKQLRIDLSKEARKMIETEFSQKVNLDRLETIFNEQCVRK